MKALKRNILEQLIAGSAEPVVVAQIDSLEWPVVFCNPAFEGIAGEVDIQQKPFADVVEELVGRELALEISETIRAGHETTIPVEVGDQEYLLALEGDTVRGGYILKPQAFAFEGEQRMIADYHLPISEGIVDGRYAPVGALILMDALKRQPLLFSLGIGG